MSLCLPHSPVSRFGAALLSGLAFAALVGCHHRSSVAVKPPAPDNVKVGYGEQSREQIGGAVQSATADEMSGVKATQVENLLEGRFPGVDVVRTRSGGFSIRIRGVSTLLGDNQPLYVVDGMPVRVDPERGLDWLSPAEIERIDVLKDPAETSMYGGRGANGVIVITTKRPR
ncbi:MAG: TonB-dependent receptor plug domain-containing protein [bacterium]